ncbi:MAG TPA: hypothetical protein VFR86_05070 [Burkholderiaceae bacterium]|nr:hypothetical protein [Burkholderiaceae bacterium]
MNFALIYRKTEKGLAVAQAPTGDLTPGMLRILHKIDGKRTEAELELLAREGEFEVIMAALLARGLIEAPGSTAQAVASGVSGAAHPVNGHVVAGSAPMNGHHPQAPAAHPRFEPPSAAPVTQAPPTAPSLDDIKRVAMRALYDRLGPYGEEAAARIQGSKTPDALRYAIQEAYRRVGFFKGEHIAREYLQAIGSL